MPPERHDQRRARDRVVGHHRLHAEHVAHQVGGDDRSRVAGRDDRSRAHRDKVNAKVMKDPRLEKMMDPKDMPFDCKRMVYGGFNVMVEG